MKIHYKKQKPNYKHFHEQSFDLQLKNELLKIDIDNAELKKLNKFFEMCLISMLQKSKYSRSIRANKSNYIKKSYLKQIMHRSRLRNMFFRERKRERDREKEREKI